MSLIEAKHGTNTAQELVNGWVKSDGITNDLADKAVLGDMHRINLNKLLNAPPAGGKYDEFALTAYGDGSFFKILSGPPPQVPTRAGSVLSEGGRFQNTGIFYVLPQINTPSPNPTKSATGTLGIAEAQSQTRLWITNNVSVPVRGRLLVEFTPGFSTQGVDRIMAERPLNQANNTDIYRLQQRLRFLGYQDSLLNPSLLEVTGQFDSRTQHAVRMFNAVAAATRRGTALGDNQIDPVINKLDAPRWVELPASDTGWRNVAVIEVDWGTHQAVDAMPTSRQTEHQRKDA